MILESLAGCGQNIVARQVVLTRAIDVVDDPLIDVLLIGMLECVQKAVVDGRRLFDDDVE